MTQSILPIAERYLRCQKMRKYAGMEWVRRPYGWSLNDNPDLAKDFPDADTGRKNALEAVTTAFNGSSMPDFSAAIVDPVSRDVLKQYVFSKIYAESHPEYLPVVQYLEKRAPGLPFVYNTLASSDQLKPQIARAQSFSPGLTRHGVYKALDQAMLEVYNKAHPDNKLTLAEFDPDLKKIDFSRYAPGIAAAGLAPVAVGALMGNMGGGALIGALLAGGLGYYGYGRTTGTIKNPTFIDRMLKTEDIGLTPDEYATYMKSKGKSTSSTTGGSGASAPAPPPAMTTTKTLPETEPKSVPATGSDTAEPKPIVEPKPMD